MQVSTLTDDELRNLVDVGVHHRDFEAWVLEVEALREAARRFVEGSSREAARIEELEDELKDKERDLENAEAAADELREQITDLNKTIKELEARIGELENV